MQWNRQFGDMIGSHEQRCTKFFYELVLVLKVFPRLNWDKYLEEILYTAFYSRQFSSFHTFGVKPWDAVERPNLIAMYTRKLCSHCDETSRNWVRWQQKWRYLRAKINSRWWDICQCLTKSNQCSDNNFMSGEYFYHKSF